MTISLVHGVPISHETEEYFINHGKDVEGSGRGLIWDTFMKFAWNYWKTLLKISTIVVGFRDEIWSQDLQNMKQE